MHVIECHASAGRGRESSAWRATAGGHEGECVKPWSAEGSVVLVLGQVVLRFGIDSSEWPVRHRRRHGAVFTGLTFLRDAVRQRFVACPATDGKSPGPGLH
jgi:hypothetical protein